MLRHYLPSLTVTIALIVCVLSSEAQTLKGSSSEPLSVNEQNSDGSAKMRPLKELINKDDPGIEVVRDWIRKAKTPVEVLSVDRAAGERALLALQVTSRSPMGAIALETGGLLLDHGWVRVLGGGNPRLPRSIHEWNRLGSANGKLRLRGACLVADDVLGGVFALNGGGLSGTRGAIFYYSPDSLEWEEVAESYSLWLSGFLNGRIEKFYEGQRWPDWQRDAERLPGDQAFSVFPFLFLSGPRISERSRRPVPITELWDIYVESLPRQLLRKR